VRTRADAYRVSRIAMRYEEDVEGEEEGEEGEEEEEGKEGKRTGTCEFIALLFPFAHTHVSYRVLHFLVDHYLRKEERGGGEREEREGGERERERQEKERREKERRVRRGREGGGERERARARTGSKERGKREEKERTVPVRPPSTSFHRFVAFLPSIDAQGLDLMGCLNLPSTPPSLPPSLPSLTHSL
jgi:hypothetical protein